MSIIYLDENFFEVRTLNGQQYFCPKINDWSLIYYFSPSCTHCHTFTPFFQNLPSSLKGDIKFGIVNANEILKTISLSQNTTTPITEVPYIMLYNNGWPVERYFGGANLESVKNLIINARNRANSSNVQSGGAAVKSPTVAPSTTSSTGNEPKNPYKICYLNYEDAYKNYTMQRTP